MRHADVDFFTSDSLEHSNRLSHVVVACVHDLNKTALDLGGSHDSVFREKIVLLDVADNVAANNVLANLEVLVRSEVPLAFLVEAGHIDTTGYEDGLFPLSNGLEGTLNTVENGLQDAYRVMSVRRGL